MGTKGSHSCSTIRRCAMRSTAAWPTSRAVDGRRRTSSIRSRARARGARPTSRSRTPTRSPPSRPRSTTCIEVLREVFPNLAFGRGRRGLHLCRRAAAGALRCRQAGQISRDNSVVIDPPSATRPCPTDSRPGGGKWTTFRSLARGSDRRGAGGAGAAHASAESPHRPRRRRRCRPMRPPPSASRTQLMASGMELLRVADLLAPLRLEGAARWRNGSRRLGRRAAAARTRLLGRRARFTCAWKPAWCIWRPGDPPHPAGDPRPDHATPRWPRIAGIAAEALGWDAARAAQGAACLRHRAARTPRRAPAGPQRPAMAPPLDASLMTTSALGHPRREQSHRPSAARARPQLRNRRCGCSSVTCDPPA